MQRTELQKSHVQILYLVSGSNLIMRDVILREQTNELTNDDIQDEIVQDN
jgi:hypothetical protein